MTRTSAWLWLVLLVACAQPFLISDYRLFQVTALLITTLALLGLNLLTGYGGQISLGHGAFYALGAYSTAILVDRCGWSPVAAVITGGGICLLFGGLFSLPALRLEGLYLALATFALAVCLPQVLKYKGFETWTGGVQGIGLLETRAPFGLPLSHDQWLYFFTLGVLTLGTWLARNLVTSHSGRVIIAIRDNPLAAAAMGIDLARYKTATFSLSALYTGFAGGLAALNLRFVAPETFGFTMSIGFVVGIVVGGPASLSGAYFGALFLTFVPDFAARLSKALPGAIYGVTVIVFATLLPGGLAGLSSNMRSPRRRDSGSSSGAIAARGSASE